MTAAIIPTLTEDERTNPNSRILDDLDQLLARYIAFPSIEARHAAALWIAHCHAVDAFESTPRLALISPEKGSGKSLLHEPRQEWSKVLVARA